jgi:hypothetical protein
MVPDIRHHAVVFDLDHKLQNTINGAPEGIEPSMPAILACHEFHSGGNGALR